MNIILLCPVKYSFFIHSNLNPNCDQIHIVLMFILKIQHFINIRHWNFHIKTNFLLELLIFEYLINPNFDPNWLREPNFIKILLFYSWNWLITLLLTFNISLVFFFLFFKNHSLLLLLWILNHFFLKTWILYVFLRLVIVLFIYQTFYFFNICW